MPLPYASSEVLEKILSRQWSSRDQGRAFMGGYARRAQGLILTFLRRAGLPSEEEEL
jgi:hypothetical protein